jgi:hypothetical protein
MTEDTAVERAKQLLVEEKGVGATEMEIELERVSATEFRDSSLDCPEKGMSYAQVIVPGYIVSLRADGEVYPVHVSAQRAVLCDRSALPRRGRSRDGRGAAPEIVAMATKELAERLDVPESTIRVQSMKRATWSSTSLGCPKEGEEYESREIPGHRIELVYEETVYTYHAGDGEFVLCSEGAMGPKP